MQQIASSLSTHLKSLSTNLPYLSFREVHMWGFRGASDVPPAIPILYYGSADSSTAICRHLPRARRILHKTLVHNTN